MSKTAGTPAGKPPAAKPAAPKQTRVRTPTILQMEAVECGAASLAIILAHFGRWVPLEELRVACGVSRDGSKASNLLRAARGYGLTAKGFKKEPDRLADMPWPLIVHWNFNHYLVFEGFKGDRAHLNDPVTGPRNVSRAEFGEAFTGVALAFERGPEFKPGRKPPGFTRLLGRQLARSRAAVGYALAATVALVLPGIALPAFTKAFVDEVLIGGQRGWLVPLLLGMTATALVRALLTALQQSALLKLETKLGMVLASRYLWRLLQLPVPFFGQRHPGDIAGRVAANDRVARLLSGELATAALNLLTVLFFGLVMLAYDPLLAGITVLLTAGNLLLLRGASRGRDDAGRRLLAEQAKLGAVTVGSIQAIETLKSAGLEGQAFERWAGHQARLLSVRQTLGVHSGLLTVAPGFLNALGTAAILGLGSVRVMDGALTVGALVAFQSLAASFSAPVATLVGMGGTLQRVTADLQRLSDTLDHPVDPHSGLAGEGGAALQPDGPARPDAARLDDARLGGAVELVDVSFGYSPLDPPLIEGLSLSLAPGMRVALVGGSGSGKSTVGRLICGLCRPWSGRILFDGRPAAEIPAGLRAASVAYVDQDVFLFDGTVRDNLTLWDATAPEASLTAALADAAILDEVAGRPGQLDAPVAEGGVNFSGGQRQRLEIARALSGNPSILVLDEATAALDVATEALIDDNLRRRGCTCVIIAHRLSTIRDCDEIIVLDHGRVVERGTHEALLARGGEYASLIAAG
ncbi:NHLP family bacteriocin export ABC transporter peptidase/permease/ATPase subunit [Azospirillum agricola]|uniref:NHLP family bacteriocin export ABC transporter peptidase/permease/ATPase subunit n=1 Tax=Azospirillum agricola TaxID=1720247 RepID=UPI000A0F1C84|nr:NHLP family bacteriocin export ABC transporter peptidase/permease/ATPase subunit [Azospirillum agricola]SMH28346.1 NHLM bacteriocin system ABC transporter, peptidase/ATP-binding protein [Azospirillum lipoferum]